MVAEWLLDSDPSIRWQVMRDLTDAPADDVAAERAKVAHEGWGAQLLAPQPPDGVWGGGGYLPEWTSVTSTLQLLRRFGVDPKSPIATAWPLMHGFTEVSHPTLRRVVMRIDF